SCVHSDDGRSPVLVFCVCVCVYVCVCMPGWAPVFMNKDQDSIPGSLSYPRMWFVVLCVCVCVCVLGVWCCLNDKSCPSSLCNHGNTRHHHLPTSQSPVSLCPHHWVLHLPRVHCARISTEHNMQGSQYG